MDEHYQDNKVAVETQDWPLRRKLVENSQTSVRKAPDILSGLDITDEEADMLRVISAGAPGSISSVIKASDKEERWARKLLTNLRNKGLIMDVDEGKMWLSELGVMVAVVNGAKVEDMQKRFHVIFPELDDTFPKALEMLGRFSPFLHDTKLLSSANLSAMKDWFRDNFERDSNVQRPQLDDLESVISNLNSIDIKITGGRKITRFGSLERAILKEIPRAGQFKTENEIEQNLHIDHHSVSRAIDELDKKGLVEARYSEVLRRMDNKPVLWLTEWGAFHALVLGADPDAILDKTALILGIKKEDPDLETLTQICDFAKKVGANGMNAIFPVFEPNKKYSKQIKILGKSENLVKMIGASRLFESSGLKSKAEPQE